MFSQTALTWAAFACVAVVTFVLYRTPLGLALRAAGENPHAVEAQGLSVGAIRMGAVIVGSGLMAVGGAFLTMSAFSSFFFEMVNGRGWICIALVVFGAWKPGKALLGALLFAGFDALQVRLQQTGMGQIVPYQVFLMIPYLLSILALVLSAFGILLVPGIIGLVLAVVALWQINRSEGRLIGRELALAALVLCTVLLIYHLRKVGI